MGNVGAPKVPGIDDVTGEPLVQRSDDKSVPLGNTRVYLIFHINLELHGHQDEKLP
jgi:hypothetical protein